MSDPDPTPDEFLRQLTDGRGRWIFTVLALLTPVAIVLPLLDPGFGAVTPFGISVAAERWLFAAVGVVWGLLAIVNWRNWGRR